MSQNMVSRSCFGTIAVLVWPTPKCIAHKIDYKINRWHRHRHMTTEKEKLNDVQRSYRSIFQIDLIAEHNKWKMIGITWTGLNEEFIAPWIQILECIRCGHIEHENTTVSATIKCNAQRLKTLLTGSIPDLHRYNAVINYHFLCQKIGANSCCEKKKVCVNWLVNVPKLHLNGNFDW